MKKVDFFCLYKEVNDPAGILEPPFSLRGKLPLQKRDQAHMDLQKDLRKI